MHRASDYRSFIRTSERRTGFIAVVERKFGRGEIAAVYLVRDTSIWPGWNRHLGCEWRSGDSRST